MLKTKTQKQKTYVFIDASNIIYGLAHYGWRMDFLKLSKYLKKRYHATRILYYAGLDPENKKQLRFYKKLQEFGYELQLVPVKTFKDGRKKADVDSRMTFELMKYFSKYNQAVIMTGDGDFYWVLEYLLDNKKRVWLIASPKHTAKELKRLFGEKFTAISRMDNLLKLDNSK